MRRLCVAASATIVAALSAASAQAAPGIQGEHARLGDRDARIGKVAPTAHQRALARREGLRATWNQFGTPRSLSAKSGSVASGLSGKPVVAARQWIAANRALLGIGSGRLELVRTAPIGAGSAVMLRQRYGSLAAARDGLIVVAVVGGRVQYVSSSLAQDTALTNAVKLDADAAVRAAAANAGLSPSDRYGQPKLVAIPTPERGVRRVWMVQLYRPGTDPQGFASYVDAETGTVLVRDSLVDHAADNPTWKVFSELATARLLEHGQPSAVVLDGVGRMRPRRRQRGVDGPVGRRLAYQRVHVHDPRQQLDRGPNWFSNNTRTVGTEPATPRPNRDYEYPWTDQWHQARCNPTTFTSAQRNDIDAAIANLFAMHNRMHDWSYQLGFTEAAWNLQAGQRRPRRPGGRPRAGQRPGGRARRHAGSAATTPTRSPAATASPPITNMYLWQPIAGAFYPPCVDGDYDMTVIGHEYTHAITNRMIGGPDAGI